MFWQVWTCHLNEDSRGEKTSGCGMLPGEVTTKVVTRFHPCLINEYLTCLNRDAQWRYFVIWRSKRTLCLNMWMVQQHTASLANATTHVGRPKMTRIRGIGSQQPLLGRFGLSRYWCRIPFPRYETPVRNRSLQRCVSCCCENTLKRETVQIAHTHAPRSLEIWFTKVCKHRFE